MPQNEYLYRWGVGAYHTGVEINGQEYTFGGGSGIFSMQPRQVPNGTFRVAHEMGNFNGNSSSLEAAIDELRHDFDPSSYNILTKNCNHFSDQLLLKLLNKNIPGYINRLAFMGSCFSCMIPPSVLGNAPVDNSIGNGYQSIPRSSHNGRISTSTATTPFSGTGKKLGGGGAQIVSQEVDLSVRRDNLRAATLSRLSNSQQSAI